MSKQTLLPPYVVKARLAVEQAAEELKSAMKTAFPVGRTVQAKLGRSVVTGTVVNVGHWNPKHADQITICNINTGKERTFAGAAECYELRLLGPEVPAPKKLKS